MLTTYRRDTARLIADCTMAREGLLDKRWSYDYGVVWRGMEQLWRITGEEKYFRYIKDAMDTFIGEDGSIRDYRFEDFNLDYICNGRQLLLLFQETGDPRYKRAADTLRQQLRQHPRTPEGGFWHKQCYPQQMWLDGLHMAAPFYLTYALMFNEGDDAIRDVAHQLTLVYEKTYDPLTGLNRHAWDAARVQPWADPVTGQSEHAWGRAMGWYMLALADVLELMPRQHECFAPLQQIFCQAAERLLAIRQDGVWQQVLDRPDGVGNYKESSVSCLVTCAILKAARLKIAPDWMGREAQASFRAIQREFVGQMLDGRMFLAKCCHVSGLGGASGRDGSYDYYMSEPVGAYDLKGTGAYIQAACEMLRIDQEGEAS